MAHINLNPTTEEVSTFIQSLKYPKLASYVVNKLVQRFGATREEAVKMWDGYRGCGWGDDSSTPVVTGFNERTTFRGLTEHEKDVLRYALRVFAQTERGPKQMKRSAQFMLDQNMVENFLWRSGLGE